MKKKLKIMSPPKLGSDKGNGYPKYKCGGTMKYWEGGVNYLDSQPQGQVGQSPTMKKAGSIGGAIGSGYYASQKPSNLPSAQGEQGYNTTMGAVSQAGPVGGVIGGVSAIGDSIGKPIREHAERIDSNTGGYQDISGARQYAVIGGLFNPFKALMEHPNYKKLDQKMRYQKQVGDWNKSLAVSSAYRQNNEDQNYQPTFAYGGLAWMPSNIQKRQYPDGGKVDNNGFRVMATPARANIDRSKDLVGADIQNSDAGPVESWGDLKNKLRAPLTKRLYSTIKPDNYTDSESVQKHIKDFAYNNKRTEKEDPYSEDAWRMYLGLPQANNTITPSQYRPTRAKDPNSKYYALPSEFKQDLYKSLFAPDENGKMTMISDLADLPEGKSKQWGESDMSRPNDSNFGARTRGRVLGNFQLSKGKDEKGDYISYYDTYDLHPELPLGVKTDVLPGKNFDVYDRIYYDSNTGKMKQFAQGGRYYSGKGDGSGNAELEDDEIFRTPDGEMDKVNGKTHAEGGEQYNLPQNTEILGKNIAPNGISYKENGDKLMRQYSKYTKILENKPTALAKKTASMMLNKVQGNYTNLMNTQEAEKQQQNQMFAYGGLSMYPDGGEIDTTQVNVPQKYVQPIDPTRIYTPSQSGTGTMVSTNKRTDSIRGDVMGEIDQRHNTTQDTKTKQYWKDVRGYLSKLPLDNNTRGMDEVEYYKNSDPRLKTLLEDPIMQGKLRQRGFQFPYGGTYGENMEQYAKGGWIKNAVNPAHKGYCTPMTKETCTPRRKAFAMTMKKHHGFHAEGGINPYELTENVYAYGGDTPWNTVIPNAIRSTYPQSIKQKGVDTKGNAYIPDSQYLPQEQGIPQSYWNGRLPEQSSPNQPSNYNFGDTVNTMGQYAPIAYNLSQGLFGKAENVNPQDYYNPYENQVMSMMGKRRYNIDPELESNRLATANYYQNLRQGAPSQGRYLAGLQAGSTVQQRANAEAIARKQNIDNQYLGEEANTLSGFGQQRSATNFQVADINARNKSAQKAYLPTALTQLQQQLQVNSVMKQQKKKEQNDIKRDNERMKLLHEYFKGYNFNLGF